MLPELNKGYIIKRDTKSAEYDALFLEGVELLQELASANWTDFNEHDPGVTILENIAYTFTNLTYKANLPIADILRESKGEDLQSGDNGFFEAGDIYTTNPVTAKDYRKLFIDRVENVKNVWIRFNETDSSAGLKNINGYYQIYVELYRYSDVDKMAEREAERVRKEVEQLYHKHRNLCEALDSVTIFDPYPLHINLKLTLDGTRDGEEIFGRIFYTLNNLLSPEVPIHSLQELQEKGERLDDLMVGPKPQNGIVLERDLKQRKEQVTFTELTKVISKIEGVVSVDEFRLSKVKKNENGDDLTPIMGEILRIPKNSSPFIVMPKSGEQLKFVTRGISFYPDLKEVQRQLSYIEAMSYGTFKSISESTKTVPIPKGEDLNIKSYFSIREQFPVVYGIGKFGLQTGLPAKRYAQINQLKAYLFPFDQLMSNFLAQLTSLYSLYDTKRHGKRSYFYQALEDMEDIVELVRTGKYEDTDFAIKQWKLDLKEISTAYDDQAVQRLNLVADNLLARFAEVFPGYALHKIDKKSFGNRITSQFFDSKALEDKRKLVSAYGELSYNRMRGYDHSIPVELSDDGKMDVLHKKKDEESDNEEKHEVTKLLPGLVQKVAILLGIQDYSIRSLSRVVSDPDNIRIHKVLDDEIRITELRTIRYSDETKEEFILDEIEITHGETKDDLGSLFRYKGNRDEIMKYVLREGVLSENYKIHAEDPKKDTRHIIFAPGGRKPSLVHIVRNADKADEAADGAIKRATEHLMQLSKDSEGLFLIEHLMLAPPFTKKCFGFDFYVELDKDRINFKQFELQPLAQRNDNIGQLLRGLTTYGIETLKIKVDVVSIKNRFEIQLKDARSNPLAVTDNQYRDKATVERDIARFKKAIGRLKPGQLKNAITSQAYYNDHPEPVEESFFSFQMSFVLPAWPVRFQNENFRTQFDNLVYQNAPAHIVFNSLWLELNDMEGFEKVYFEWLKTMGHREDKNMKDPEHEKENMKHSYALIKMLEKHCDTQKQ